MRTARIVLLLGEQNLLGRSFAMLAKFRFQKAFFQGFTCDYYYAISEINGL